MNIGKGTVTEAKGKAVQERWHMAVIPEVSRKSRRIGSSPGLQSWFKVSLLRPFYNLGNMRPPVSSPHLTPSSQRQMRRGNVEQDDGEKANTIVQYFCGSQAISGTWATLNYLKLKPQACAWGVGGPQTPAIPTLLIWSPPPSLLTCPTRRILNSQNC